MGVKKLVMEVDRQIALEKHTKLINDHREKEKKLRECTFVKINIIFN